MHSISQFFLKIEGFSTITNKVVINIYNINNFLMFFREHFHSDIF